MRVVVKRYDKDSAFRAIVILIWEENGRQIQKSFYRYHNQREWLWWTLDGMYRKSHHSPTLKAAIASWRLQR